MKSFILYFILMLNFCSFAPPTIALNSPHLTQNISQSSQEQSKPTKNRKTDSQQKNTLEPVRDKEAEKAAEEFTSSWKFYFIMLIFPIILILIFVLVFLRGKRG